MRIIPLLILLGMVLPAKATLAVTLQAAQPIPQVVEESDIILIGRLETYAFDKAHEVTLTPSGKDALGHFFYTGPSVYIAINSIKEPGTYNFTVLKVLKGAYGPNISLSLPYILSIYYGGARPPIEPQSNFLLFLRKNGSGYSITEATVPIVPLSTHVIQADNTGDVDNQIANYLISSLDTVSLRQADTYLLRPFISTRIVAGLVPFLNDINIHTRDNVLSCMAANQQVSIIPNIVKLSHDPKLMGQPLDAVSALRSYTVPQAIPYLNPLLFNQDYDIRINAMRSLYRIADKTSLPYMILALRDPVPGGDVQASAYVALRRLIPSLGAYVPVTSDYFTNTQYALFKPIYAWWSDELLGKHLKPGEHPAIPSPLPDTPAQLYPLLFIPDVGTRRAAAARLAQIGDAGSIPYLVLALQDPDTQQPDVNVSYVAYKALHRLIPSLGPAADSDNFAADHAAMTQSIYDWWRDELSGKHLPAQHP